MRSTGGFKGVAGEGLRESVAGDGLGEVIIHAGFDAERAILRRDSGGKGDDRSVAPFAFEPADLTGGLKAIHAGHLDVHENDLETGVRHEGHCFRAAWGGLNGAAQFLEQKGDDAEIDNVVLDDQDAEAGWRRRGRLWSGGRVVESGCWNAEPKRGTKAEDGLGADLTAEGVDNFP